MEIHYSATISSPKKEVLAPSFFQLPEYINNNHVVNPVAISDKESRLSARNKIESYENAIGKMVDNGAEEKGDEVNANGLKEYHAGGAYIRELFIPKGITAVSKIWKKDRMWIIASGEVTITTELGTKRVKAPYREVVPIGIKVAFYAHEDTLWFAITGAKDKDNIKDEVIANDYDECVFPWIQEIEQ